MLVWIRSLQSLGLSQIKLSTGLVWLSKNVAWPFAGHKFLITKHIFSKSETARQWNSRDEECNSFVWQFYTQWVWLWNSRNCSITEQVLQRILNHSVWLTVAESLLERIKCEFLYLLMPTANLSPMHYPLKVGQKQTRIQLLKNKCIL